MMPGSLELDVDYLEDLESRLYSQVFHSTTINDEFSETFNPINTTCEVPTHNMKNYRYFTISSSLSKEPPSTFIPLAHHESLIESNEKSPFIQNNINISPTSTTVITDTNCDGVVQNNITVNQFTVPLIIQSDYPDTTQVLSPSTNSQYINPWSDDFSDRDKVYKNTQIRRRYRSKRKVKKIAQVNVIMEPVEVITLSDDSSNECVLVENNLNTEFPKKYEENSGTKKPESDDDIIYVAPPPLEIINIDVDDNERTNLEKPVKSNTKSLKRNVTEKEQNIVNPAECTVSNDFLDTVSMDSTTKFNFSLHGVDFNSQSDFIKPPNPDIMPLESCETESSCSTNEQHSRDFNNTVKTIVFDEVEFPREDIFTERNLESFKTFITPQRSPKAPSDKSNEHADKSKQLEDVSNSNSSSESDYGEQKLVNRNYQNVRTNKMLPVLSPMATENVSKRDDNQENSIQACTFPIKRKSDAMDKSNSKDNECMYPDNYKRSKKKKKKFRKLDFSDTDQKTQKKKPVEEEFVASTPKRKSSSLTKSGSDAIGISECPTIPKSKKRKKKTEQVSTPVGDKDKSKNRKKKKDMTQDVSNQLDAEVVQVETDTVKIPTDKEQLNESASTLELDNADSLNLTDFIVVDSVDNNLTEMLTVDEATVTDIEVVSSVDGDDTQVVDIENDLQLSNCVKDSQSSNIGKSSTTALSTYPSINQIQRDRIAPKPFDMYDIQKTQSDDPNKWQISFKDRARYANMARERGPRCNRCRRVGHMASKCAEKPNEPSCVLCGTRGHVDTRCSVKMCNQCGRHGDYNLKYCESCFAYRQTECGLCQMPGHPEKFCPDLWRRYHLTTAEGPIVVAEGPTLKPQDQRWCSGCARRGHLEHECTYYRREYPPTTSEVFNYEDVLYPENNNLPTVADVLPLQPNRCPPSTVTSESCGGSDNASVYPGPAMAVNQSLDSIGKVLNPFSLQNELKDNVLDSMKLNFINDVVPPQFEGSFDSGTVRNVIMTKPTRYLMDFIKKNMEELETVASRCNPVQLKKIYFMCEHANKKKFRDQRLRKEYQMKYRPLNMFIFGVYGFRDGPIHMNYLKRFLSGRSTPLDQPVRKSLLSSYNYIFGCDKHSTVNYIKIINMIKSGNFKRRFP